MNKNIFSGKKIIVTGGAGFIGSTLVKALTQFGADVSVIDNLWRGSLENLRLNKKEYAIDTQKKFHLADLTDYGKCLEIIRDADYVYHLADVVAGINFIFKNEVFVYRQNILINTNTISACVVNNINIIFMLVQHAAIQKIYRCRMELFASAKTKHIRPSLNHLMDGVN